MTENAPRVLCWVQNLLGSGHLKRQLRIGEAAVDAGCRFAIANGGFPGTFSIPHGIEWYQLPPLRSADDTFSTLIDDKGRPVEAAYWELRQKKLFTIARQFRPHVVVTEMFPFGRRKFNSEIVRWLASLDRSIKRVASVRDVLVTPKKPERALEHRDLVLQYYDHVLVHSDPRIQPLEKTFSHTDAIASKLTYSGYVTAAGLRPQTEKAWEVVLSVGSGIVGRQLIETAIMCRRKGILDHKPWLIVTGKQANEDDFQRWRLLKDEAVHLERFVSDLPRQIAASELSVSQAGYNTIAETMFVRTPMLLVPFETSTEDEQIKRATTMESLGCAVTLRQADLDVERLSVAMIKAHGLRPPDLSVDLSGAENSARILSKLALGTDN